MSAVRQEHAIAFRQDELTAWLGAARVLPVVTVDRPEQAIGLARALAAGGLKAIEITLRTPGALAAIEGVAREVPEMVVGAGTVSHPHDLETVARAGARFAVSPGLTPALATAAAASALPLVPGVATASEAMVAREAGFRLLKLFPAAALGGLALLRALAGPLPDLRFCPTGGIDGATFRDYLALPNVICVGGSWMVPRASLARGDWGDIRRRAQGLSA